jgi:hypothetical protein
VSKNLVYQLFYYYYFMEKNFIIRCLKCRWARMSTGLSEDLKDLKETTGCSSCGKPRTFRCPQCGLTAKQTRVKSNN